MQTDIFVLIESYWNLKTNDMTVSPDALYCINRIILEFKARRHWQESSDATVLIESYWNLKKSIPYNIFGPIEY